MKKPKITKAPWKQFNGTDVFTDHSEDEEHENYIADCNIDSEWSYEKVRLSLDEQYANGKAIAQVPNMIDALIEVYNYLIETDPDSETYNPNDIMIDKIEQVLKDAGCEL